MRTKIFCDIADYKTIKFFNNKSLVDGFTTNPSLMRLAGAKNYKKYSLKILNICKKKPISFEVFADSFTGMLKQAYEINSWGKNVYVKIPVVNSKGIFTGPVIKELSDKGIKLNITAVYTFEQTAMIFKKLNKKTKSIISIFLFFLVKVMLFLKIGRGSLPLSAILPANIEIIDFVFLFNFLKIFLVCSNV